MAVPFFLALAGSAASAYGGMQAQEATVEGAETQAAIEAMSRASQKKRFEENLEYTKPFFEAGERAVKPYGEAIAGKFDYTKSPLYTMQKDMVMNELGDAPEYVKQGALERLDAVEQQQSKTRLLDLQKIGLGMAGAAGGAAINFGTAYASSLQRGQGALAQGTLEGAMQKQNIYTSAMEQLSGYPAYVKQQSYLSQPQSMNMNAQAQLPGGKTSVFTNYDLTY